MMSKEPYNINTINALAIIPGGLRRNLRKADIIYVSDNHSDYIKGLLTKDSIGYSCLDHAFNIKMFVIH